LRVPDSEPGIPKLIGEVPHCGEDQSYLQLVMLHIRCFLHYLAHQDYILRGISTIEARHFQRKLIA
jgi:hypothetical protein